MPKQEQLPSAFKQRDLPQIISLLNNAEKDLRDFRPYTEEEFSNNTLLDEAFDPNGLILSWEERKLVGAVLAQVDPEYVRFQSQLRGFIRWIRVRPQIDTIDLRTTLLQAALSFITSKQMKEVQVSVPNHNHIDLDFYQHNDFKLIRKFNYMERILDEPSQSRLPSGYVWTHFNRGEEKEWVDCINAAFRNHWGKRPTSLSEFSRWTAEASFDPTGIIGIRKKGMLVGMIYCEIDLSYVEYTHRRRSMLWIIGVIPSERGLGLGEKLTLEGMNWSLSNGMRIAALYVDRENTPGLTLYQKLRFETIYEVHHLLKELSR